MTAGERSLQADIAGAGSAAFAEEEWMVRAAAAGDVEQFLKLYDRFAPGVYGYGLRRLREPSRAEDLVQEVFLALVRRGASYRGRAPLYAFVYRIARNRVHNMWRDARPEVELEDRAGAAPAYDAALSVRAALARLPDRFREPIELATYEGMTYDEIAEVIGCPIGTVRSRVSRGKRMLLEFLGGASR